MFQLQSVNIYAKQANYRGGHNVPPPPQYTGEKSPSGIGLRKKVEKLGVIEWTFDSLKLISVRNTVKEGIQANFDFHVFWLWRYDVPSLLIFF